MTRVLDAFTIYMFRAAGFTALKEGYDMTEDIKVSYRINYEKAIETLVWLASRKPGIDIYHVSKVIFYADKTHLNKYARPILGDSYICMNYGPVPSGIRDLIEGNSWLSPDHLDGISGGIKVNHGPHENLTPLREPDLDFFSETDIECLEASLIEYGEKSFSELRRLTHNEKCYLATNINQPIDIALMVDENNPLRQEILEEISQTAPYLQA